MRVSHLLDALIQCEQSTKTEEYERNDERPEVSLSRVAEWVVFVCFTKGPLVAQHEKALIASIGKAVERFSDESRRPGQQKSDELRDCYSEVGKERRNDRLFAAFVHRSRFAHAHMEV